MRTFVIFTFLITICCQMLNAQNLVPNPSFEDTVNCNGPWNCCSIEIAYPWFNPNTATSDFFTNSPNCGYPTNYQMPNTGNSYSGIFGYLLDTREYIEVKLDTSLMPGKKYCLEFYVSRNEGCSGATDRIGAYFSIDSLLSNDPANFPLIPQIETPSGLLLSDTSQWIIIQGSYVAQGGENFLTIGNFRDTSNCIFQIMDSSNFLCTHAYYFIDDVSLIYCDSASFLIEEPPGLDISLDNLTEYYILNFNQYQNYKFELYNINGINLSNKCQLSENQVIIYKEFFATGIYIIRIIYNDYIINFKIYI